MKNRAISWCIMGGVSFRPANYDITHVMRSCGCQRSYHIVVLRQLLSDSSGGKLDFNLIKPESGIFRPKGREASRRQLGQQVLQERLCPWLVEVERAKCVERLTFWGSPMRHKSTITLS